MRTHNSSRPQEDDLSEAASSNPWRILGLWTFFILAVLAALASVCLLALFGAVFVNEQQNVNIIAFVALGIQLVSVCLFLSLAWKASGDSGYNVQSETRGKRIMNICVSFVLCALATAGSVATAVWIQVLSSQIPGVLHRSPSAFVAGLIVSAVAAFICQTAFLAIIALTRPNLTVPTAMPNESMPEIATISRPQTAKSKSTIYSNPFSSRTDTEGPTSPSSISLRSSLSFTLPSRAGSSKTRRTVSRPSSKSADVSQLDFSWDTSGVPAALRDTVQTYVRTVPSQLPPIPGSRPSSPAKALDGPFLPPSPHPAQSQPSSPVEATFSRPTSPPIETTPDILSLSPPQPPFVHSSPSRSRASSVASSSNDSLYLRQPRRSASATSLAESVSHLRTQPSFDEENIHPLFRTNSPTPPPTASRNTIVRAASVIDAEETAISGTRKRAGSRVGSPLAQHSEIFGNSDDTISPIASLASPEFFTPIESKEEQPAWPFKADSPKESSHLDSVSEDTANEEEEENSVRGRRRDEGPIPSFILAAGHRGSMIAFEERQRKSEISKDDQDEDFAG